MALNTDLVGSGIPDVAARRLGLPTQITITAAGTTTSDATVFNSQNKVIIISATGSDGIRFPDNTPLNTPFWFFNASGSTGKVYPPTGGAINGGSTDAGLSITTLKTALMIRTSTTRVISLLTA